MSQDPEHHCQAIDVSHDAAAIRSALLELVILKDMKTRHGESAEYRIRRDQAWVEARRALGLVEAPD
ncbi:hypothetical protein P7D22_00060 [Lichenihabitans sp. Uapishka_5]|uniref:hypothetical protein n=1 Tax=Lichenihabitans sp. Uapishka_5 TaxID=3037302 RepID=UPI0029E7D4C3|nr:hypothetical protein [Lichenihabitans sp. Uapishka_5]MDX7949572.1 hypothetical protein [Lichenihabitans sp. Uapishka_5]